MKNRKRFFLFFFLSLFLITLTSFMTLARAGFHGDANSGVDVVLGNSLKIFDNYFPTYSSNNDIFYSSHELQNFNLPLIFKYNGTLTQPTLVISTADINTVLAKLNASDSISIKELLFLVNQTYTVPNVTTMCTPVPVSNLTANKSNCTTNVGIITKWKWNWIKLVGTTTLNKNQWYAIDLTAIRNVSTNPQAIDVKPNILGFPISEFAWWNSSFSSCRNLNLNSAYYNYTIGMNLTFTGAKSDWGDLRFVDQTCNNGGNRLNYWFERNTSNWVQAWVYTGGQSLSALSVYYGDSNSNYIGNGFQTFPLFDNFCGGSLNTSIWATNIPGGASAPTIGNCVADFSGYSGMESLQQFDSKSAIVFNGTIINAFKYIQEGLEFNLAASGNNLNTFGSNVAGTLTINVGSTSTAQNYAGGQRFQIIRNGSQTDNSYSTWEGFSYRDNSNSVNNELENAFFGATDIGTSHEEFTYVFMRNYTFPDASVTVGTITSQSIPPTFDNGTLNTTYQNTTLVSNNNTGYNNLGNMSFSRNITDNQPTATIDTITFMLGGNITTQNYTNRNVFQGIQILNRTVQGIFYLNMTFPNLTTGRFWYLWSGNLSNGDYNQTENLTFTILLAPPPPLPPPPPPSTAGLSNTYCADDNSTLVIFDNQTFINAQGSYWNATNETQRCPYGCDASLNICDPPPYLIYLYIGLLTFITIVFVFVIKRLASR